MHGYKLQIARNDKSAMHRIVPIVTREYCAIYGVLIQANRVFKGIDI